MFAQPAVILTYACRPAHRTHANTGALAKYTFIISVKAASTIGLHIIEIGFVGAGGSAVEVVQRNIGDYCVGNDGTSDRHGAHFDTLVDGNTAWMGGIACNVPAEVGTKAIEIMAPANVNQLAILYNRPVYAPGWKILRDGVVVMDETSNRGGAWTPDPVSYDYVLAEG